MHNNKVDLEDFTGYPIKTRLASAKRKALDLLTYIYEDGEKVDLVYQVHVNIGKKNAESNGYMHLTEAISIYNMAE